MNIFLSPRNGFLFQSVINVTTGNLAFACRSYQQLYHFFNLPGLRVKYIRYDSAVYK